MGVASCRSISILSDVVFNHASVSFRFSIRVFLSISGRVCSGFSAGLRPGLALGARPWCPHLPHVRPLPLSISFSFPAQQLPLPLFHLLCPRCDPVDGYRRSSSPKVSAPSLHISSPLPPFLPPPRGFLASDAIPVRGLPSRPPRGSLVPLRASPRGPCVPLTDSRRGPRRGSLHAHVALGAAPCSVPGVARWILARAALAHVTFKI
jgi:hypothetical protein